jgi:predicted nucleic acid-binding protein
MRRIVDTDVLIDAGRNVPDALHALAHPEQSGRLATSIITQMELVVGCRDKQELQQLRQFLARFDVLPVRAAASRRAADLVEQFFLSHGLLIPDALIAATAIDHNLPLLTKNQRDFRFIPGLRLLPYP